MESRASWFQSPGGTGQNYGYLTLGTCFPIGQPVSGTVHLDLKLGLYDNPGTITVVSPKIATNAGQVQLAETPLSLTCTTECEFTVPVNIDTTASPYDGFEELRLLTNVLEPNTHEMRASDGWLLDIHNGKPLNNMWTNGREEGRGWYTHTGYANALFLSPIPTSPLAGTWIVTYNANPGGTGLAVSSRELRIDATPDSAGILVHSSVGGGTSTVSIDLSALAPGLHHLVLETHTLDTFFGGNVLTGSEVIPFEVQ